MHAVFMGMTTASRKGRGGDASLQSDGVLEISAKHQTVSPESPNAAISAEHQTVSYVSRNAAISAEH